jgi:hypothetical protein
MAQPTRCRLLACCTVAGCAVATEPILMPQPPYTPVCMHMQDGKPLDQRKLHPSPKVPTNGSPATRGLIKAYTGNGRAGKQAAADTLDLGTSSDEEGQARPGRQAVAMFSAAPGAAPAVSRSMQAPQASMLHAGTRAGPHSSGYMPVSGSKEVYARKQAAKQALQQVRAGAAAVREQRLEQQEVQQQPMPPPIAKELSYTRRHIGMAAAQQGMAQDLGPSAGISDMPSDESQLQEGSWRSYSGSGEAEHTGEPSSLPDPPQRQQQLAGYHAQQQLPSYGSTGTTSPHSHHMSPGKQPAAPARSSQAAGSPTSAEQPRKLSHLQMQLAKKRLQRATASSHTSASQRSPPAAAPTASHPHHSAPTSPIRPSQRAAPSMPALRSSWAAGSRGGQQQPAPVPAPAAGLMSPPSTVGGTKTMPRMPAAGPSRLAPAASSASAQLDSLILQLQHYEPTLEELAGLSI